jgi:homogentisate 1,2-dioxygenase
MEHGRGGDRPFGATLNGAMVLHGVDKRTHEEARKSELRPEKVGMEGFMMFLLESKGWWGLVSGLWRRRGEGQGRLVRG